MEKYPKFILIELEGVLTLILMKVTYHKEIASELIDVVKEKDKIKGGGWFNYKDKTFTFSGDSHDFGKANLEDIQLAINNGEVYSDNRLYRNITNEYNFSYDTQTEILELKKLEA